MTGTPLDLTPFGSLLTGIGWFYWLLAGGGLWWALRGARPWKSKLIRVIPVLLIFGLIPFRSAWYSYQVRSRLDEAIALFNERCKTAGETIHQTVQNVEGVVLLNVRPDEINRDDQFRLDDPYGSASGGEQYIKSYLVERYNANATANGSFEPRERRAFRYVDVPAADGTRQRYTATFIKFDSTIFKKGEGTYVVSHAITTEIAPRYGVIWADISTHVDRERWIAGGSLKVMDLQDNKLIAERIGYVVDRGQGGKGGFRDPWPWATYYGPTCPRPQDHNLVFVLKALQPTKQSD